MDNSRNISKVMQELNNGILPPELMFIKNENDNVIDLDKLKYNTFYKTPEYFDSMLPNCLKQLPGYEKMLERIVKDNENITLSQAINNRKKNEENEVSE